MIANIVVGLIFGVIVITAAVRVYRDRKNNRCSCGCSGGCTQKTNCCN